VNQVTTSGKTTEEAIQSALDMLKVSRDQAEIRIIDEGRKGVLGIFGAKRAVVQASRKKTPVEQAEQYLAGMIAQMGIDAKITSLVKGRNLSFEIHSDQAARLIGKRGQTLNALEYLVQLTLNHLETRYVHVELDAEGYRQKRKEALKQLAERMADKAVATGSRAALEPMPSFERKIVHAALQRRKDIKTFSNGKEPHRHVVIEPATERMQAH